MTIDSFDLNNDKGININKYKNIYELEKDINEHYIKIKNNPLFKTKKKILKKKMNNNYNINNNGIKQNKLPSDKSKEKKIEKISKNNTTMTFNTNANSIIYNINNLINQKEVNKSYDSTLNKKDEEKEKSKLTTSLKTENNNNNKIIQIKPSSNSSPKKMKEEKKNNVDESKEKANVFLNEYNTFKNKKYIRIKHNKTNLMKKNSMNKMKINPNKKEFDTQISFNGNSIRKNSPENSLFLKNMNPNKSNKSNKNRGVIIDKNEIKNKNKSPTNNNIINNNSNKNCHIIPFKKYKINYIKDKNNVTKMKKINTNNYYSEQAKGKNNSKNFGDNSQLIKSLPKEVNNTNKNSYIKV